MNDRLIRQYNSFVTTVAFGTQNAADFAPTSALPGYFTQLGQTITKMDAAKAGQLGGSGADVTEGLISALQADLQLIGGIARSLDEDNPGLKDKFPTVGTTDQSILTTADAYLNQLEIRKTDDDATQTAKTTLANLFSAHEMPDTFVEELRADRDAVAPASAAQAGKSSGKVENTAALTLFARQGMKLRQKIVAGVSAKYSRQSDKLRAAQSATHLERAPQRSNGKSGNGAAAGGNGGTPKP